MTTSTEALELSSPPGPPDDQDDARFAAPVRIECRSSEPFDRWLSELAGSLALTTYQAGKLAVLGWRGSQPSLLGERQKGNYQKTGIAVS